MEQSTLSDSTRMPAAQVEMRDPGTEQAVTALLTAPANPHTTSAPPAEPMLVAMVAEWRALRDRINDPISTEAVYMSLGGRFNELRRAVYAHPIASLHDFLAKVPVFQDDLGDAVMDTAEGLAIHGELHDEACIGLFRDFERLPRLAATTAPLVEGSIAARTGPLPKPGSAEAMAAFRAACTETDRLMLAARDGYPALERADGSTWTKQRLLAALEAGEIAPAEYARLHRLAAERELRIDAAALASDITALHALAYADSYPEGPGGNEVQDGVGDAEGSDIELLTLGRRFEIAAGNEVVACAKANAAEAQAEPDPGRIAEADATANDAGDIAADLAHRIAGIPAHTADGLRLKIRALVHYNAAAFADPPDMPDPDQALAHSLRMDATRLGLEASISAEVEAQAIADGIEKLWPEWAALNKQDYQDTSPEAEKRCDAMFERRMALIEAAEALPPSTSRAVRYAKALAFAWYEHVGLWVHRKLLSEYGLDGRLVLDIETSMTGKPAWTGASA